MNCPDCGSNNTSTHHHETTCNNCGLIIDDNPTEQPTNSTITSAGTHQCYGHRITTGWLFTTKERNLHHANATINLATSQLKLPNHIKNEARQLFQETTTQNLTIGRDNQSFVYACIYAACNNHRLPKTPRDITKNTTLTPKKLLRAYRHLNRQLHRTHHPIKATDLLPRYAATLNLPPITIAQAATILEQHHTTGHHPETSAASALYLAAKQTHNARTQREIANTTGVIEVTIRKIAKTLQEETP